MAGRRHGNIIGTASDETGTASEHAARRVYARGNAQGETMPSKTRERERHRIRRYELPRRQLQTKHCNQALMKAPDGS